MDAISLIMGIICDIEIKLWINILRHMERNER